MSLLSFKTIFCYLLDGVLFILITFRAVWAGQSCKYKVQKHKLWNKIMRWNMKHVRKCNNKEIKIKSLFKINFTISF